MCHFTFFKVNSTYERQSGQSVEITGLVSEPPCLTLSVHETSSPENLPLLSLPGKHSDTAMNKRIKQLFKQIKSRLTDKPELLEELSTLKNNQSGVPSLENLKHFKTVHLSNIVNNTNIVNANFVDNRVINNITNITNSKPNPCDWSNTKLSKFYALLEDPNIISGVEKYLQDPAWLTQFSSVGRGQIKKEKSFQTETVIE